LIQKMTVFLERLSRPDGTLHQFNDCADGQGPSAREIIEWVRAGTGQVDRGSDPAFAFPDSGYFGWTGGSGRFVMDAGIVGPPEQPGHAHCDLGSFELDIRGYPLVVDSGVHGYGGDRFREYARSTRAHNTVSICGREQSEMWSTFRVARTARLGPVRFERTPAGVAIELSYRPFGSRFVHHRRAQYVPGILEVSDRIARADGCTLKSWLHFAPRWSLEAVGNTWIARGPGPGCRIEVTGGPSGAIVTGSMNPVQGWTFPQFGVAVPADTLELTVPRYDGRPVGYRIEELSP
jgi:hypothetical protein